MTLNQMLSKHWTERRRDKQAWKILVKGLMGLGDAEKKRKVTLMVHRARVQDVDNRVGSAKHLVDALVFWSHIVDDRPAFLDLVVIEEQESDKARRGTMVEVEDDEVEREVN